MRNFSSKNKSEKKRFKIHIFLYSTYLFTLLTSSDRDEYKFSFDISFVYKVPTVQKIIDVSVKKLLITDL